jgi:hypothetical protein
MHKYLKQVDLVKKGLVCAEDKEKNNEVPRMS